ISDRIIGITHFAKGVGPVRIESSGRVYELSSFSKRFRPISSASGASANAYVPENLEGEISSVSSSVIRGIRGLGML
ncbi:MAG: hypothetical protein IH845_05650, partial [Nanoarchaeota archaeon]|nr:hypothetical protein [Nanoarchaeota archaeon]